MKKPYKIKSIIKESHSADISGIYNDLIQASLAVFKKHFPKGEAYGEDFYPDDEESTFVNDILSRIIDEGYAQFEDKNDPEGPIFFSEWEKESKPSPEYGEDFGSAFESKKDTPKEKDNTNQWSKNKW